MTEPVPDLAAESPAFTVVKGHPSDEELAALLVVLTAQQSDAAQSSAALPGRSGWSAYWRAAGAPLLPGPGSWRASGR